MNTYKQTKPQETENDTVEPEVIETTSTVSDTVENKTNKNDVLETELTDYENSEVKERK